MLIININAFNYIKKKQLLKYYANVILVCNNYGGYPIFPSVYGRPTVTVV